MQETGSTVTRASDTASAASRANHTTSGSSSIAASAKSTAARSSSTEDGSGAWPKEIKRPDMTDEDPDVIPETTQDEIDKEAARKTPQIKRRARQQTFSKRHKDSKPSNPWLAS
ncbi:hypothetical protein Q8A67_000054 [Cirrhinus molitorella]|uniref:Uncharacterized protein n=1 Tax=Cirrhinus molitorella TaxID=172907 RepID=A0AA88QIW2_9TELE|nr:hypothetical protein Q8A67_000054 [Cirrhinus molitorella]